MSSGEDLKKKKKQEQTKIRGGSGGGAQLMPPTILAVSGAQVASTRPKYGPPPSFIWPGTLFLPSSSTELLLNG